MRSPHYPILLFFLFTIICHGQIWNCIRVTATRWCQWNDSATDIRVTALSRRRLHLSNYFRCLKFRIQLSWLWTVDIDLRVYELGISTAIVLRINLVSISIFLISVIFFVWICILSRRWICIRITFLDFSAIFFVWIRILSRRVFFKAIFLITGGIEDPFSAWEDPFSAWEDPFSAWEDPIINYCGFGHYLELKWSLVYRSIKLSNEWIDNG